MNHKMYRVCLLMVAIAATTGGIMYYWLNHTEVATQKGTLVNQMQNTKSKMKKMGKTVVDEMANALEQTVEEMKYAAENAGGDVKEAAKSVGHEVKSAATVTGHEWKKAAKNVSKEVQQEFAEGCCKDDSYARELDRRNMFSGEGKV